METQSLPIAIVGAGPIGLAAAAHVIKRGETPLIFEAGTTIAASVLDWGHVRVFSPWQYNVDATARELLEASGWQMPQEDYLPLGKELVDDYLTPLAALPAIKDNLKLNAKVTAISRRRIDKMKDAGRTNAPFIIEANIKGTPERFMARAVIDASGNWTAPNPLGSDGLPAIGETEFADRIAYGIPDVLGKDRDRYIDKTVTVIGGGHSAINALLELADLQDTHPSIQLHWLLRKAGVADAYGGLGGDALPGRGLLGIRIKELVDAKRVVVHTPVFLTKVESAANGQIRLHGDTLDAPLALETDEIIAATGARPDLSFLRELRVSLDPAVEATPELAPLIDPNVHSCGTVRPHGEKELRHPEKDFYIVGVKSYGRAPTFLLATGYEQVRSVVAGLVGDWEAAADVQLDLPETGVCGVNIVDSNGVAEDCCAPTCCDTPAESNVVPLNLIQLDTTNTEESCCAPTCCSTEAESKEGQSGLIQISL